ncbi:MAG: FecR domain-containing protein [Balneolaceae bacterium]
MKEKEKIWPVIVRYLDNSIDDNELLMLENWLDKSNDNRRALHAADRILKASEETTQESLIDDLNLEEDWDKILNHINADTPEETRARVLHFRKLRKRHQLFSTLLKVAALVLVAFTSVFFTLQYTPQQTAEYSSEPVLREISTNAGERASIELGDGSRVMMNAATKMVIPETFSASKRSIELEGQAFFDIKSDRSRPFYIHTNNSVVEVIGTSFDVRSYEEGEDVVVVVREGTVELSEHDNPDNNLIVNEGYKGTITRSNGHLMLDMIDDADTYFGWMDGRLIFKDTPIIEVFKDLERWYDISVQYEDVSEELMDKKFTADLKTRSIREVFEVIQMSMEIDFEIDGDDVRIIQETM